MAIESETGAPGSWDVLAVHDWTGDQPIETSLSAALDGLDGGMGEATLYEYVDVERVTDAIEPERSGRGASEVRFDYDGYEVRIARDGTIAVR